MADRELSKDLTAEQFQRYQSFIHEHSGIYLERNKLDSLRISLVARATRLSLASLDEYLEVLKRDETEFKELLNLITINETSFFRFPAQFEAFQRHVIPEIMANKIHGQRELRVWSAGCSTGEEPYSIAMTLLDSGAEGLGWKPHVYGSDVSTKALSVAKAGVYPKKAMLNVPDDVVTRHFDADAARNEFRLKENVRRVVEFGYHNLIKEPYPLALMGNWDVIFCRNVTIYFQLESTRRVVANFFNSLNEGGYLFIGHSETLTSISDDFEAVEVGGVFLYRKPLKGASRVARFTSSAERARRREMPSTSSRTERPSRMLRQSRSSSAAPQPTGVPAPPDRELLGEAQARLRDGKPDEVLALVQEVLANDPTSAEAYLLSAYVHADAGRYEQALVACEKALAINPLLPVARYILAIIYQQQGDLTRAISELKKTVYVESDFALAHLNLGNIYKSQKRWEDAAREYENAIRALYKNPEGTWTEFLGGFKIDLLAKTCERSLLECRKALGSG